MHLLRHLLSCLSVALIIALSTNGIAMAANDFGHQAHCVDAYVGSSHATDAHQSHDHNGLAAQHAAPDHDHETCMMHACPALSTEAVKLGELADTILTKLVWPERPLQALEHPDGLKRPPKS